MRPLLWLTLGVVLGLGSVTVPDVWLLAREAQPDRPSSASSPDRETLIEVSGKTQPVPGRAATIAPTVLHPVVAVRVVPGDRVKKDQPLIKLDDDESRADVRARTAALAELKAALEKLKAQPRKEELEEARALLQSARESAGETAKIVKRMKRGNERGFISDAAFHAATFNMRKAAADEQAVAARLQQLLKKPIKLEIAEAEARVANAQAALDSATAELEHYLVTAPIDGLVSWLEVTPGTVSRPGTTVWGEILDLSEIDVRCDLTPEQADRITVSQAVEVRQTGQEKVWAGRVVSVAVAADRKTGKLPVLVRIKDARERLRCRIEVTVRFRPRKNASAPRALPDGSK
jgi:multidrug resistance efflux pump